jgi:hypothetical protein
MKLLAFAVLGTGLAFERLEEVRSPTRVYKICKKLDLDVEAEVYQVVSYGLEEEAKECSGTYPKYVLKCTGANKEHNVEREYALMQNQLHGVSWIPETFELFPVSKRVFCYSMEELGMSLRHMRRAHDEGQVWPWITLATIGAHTLELVKEMHIEKGIFKSHLRTKSWFLPQIPKGEIALPTSLKMIDFGEAREVSHPRAPAKILEEVREQVLSLRYLLDGDDKFYSWKHYDYEEEEICADVPEVYCEAIKYVKNLNQGEEIDYDSLIGMMVQIVHDNGGEYTGEIDWEPLVQAHSAPPRKLKAKEKKDKNDQPHAEAEDEEDETNQEK